MLGTSKEMELYHVFSGDLKRIDVYAQNGFQIPQVIPGEVRHAYDKLCEMAGRNRDKLDYF